ENELTRRLRRRFLWYCGLTIALAALLAMPGLFTGPNPNNPPGVETLSRVTHVIGLVPFIIGFALAWYRPLSRPQILRLALWVYVLGTIPTLVGTRLAFQRIFTPQVTRIVMEQQEQQFA